MIRVNRDDVKKPSALDGDDSKAAKELAKAREYFKEKEEKKGKQKGEEEKKDSFSFKVYKDDTVKTALEKLFHKKCAYCETIYAASQPVDIEHYRPKNAYRNAKGTLVKPGYWWLAADWDNLLPSCIDCNRKRTQREAGEEKTKSLGKANKFPIADETKRATKEGDEKHEQRLLLDPCRDRPDLILFFSMKGVVKVKQDRSDHEKRMVEASQEVYGLNRNGLATQRRSLAVTLRGRRNEASRAATAWEKNKSEASRTELANVTRELLERHNAKAAYSGLARQMVGAVLDSLRTFVDSHFGSDLKEVDDDSKESPNADGDKKAEDSKNDEGDKNTKDSKNDENDENGKDDKKPKDILVRFVDRFAEDFDDDDDEPDLDAFKV